jgi:predicted nucleic-acid-binding protein
VVAVDTNVLVRFLTRDDRAQASRAAKLISSQEVFIPTTVLLETEWVLRRLYRFPRNAVLSALSELLAIENVSVENPVVAAEALKWSSAGLDFADALHISSSIRATEFATFDGKLARRAKDITTVRVAEVKR